MGAGARSKAAHHSSVAAISSAICGLASPRLDVQIDRNRALALGVTPDQIANTLYDAYGNRRVTTITAASDQYDVDPRGAAAVSAQSGALKDLYIRSSAGKMVPLSAVTDLKQTVAPLSVNHIGQLAGCQLPVQLEARRCVEPGDYS